MLLEWSRMSALPFHKLITMLKMRNIILAAITLLMSQLAFAQCIDLYDAKKLVMHFPHKPVLHLPVANLEEAYCTQNNYVQVLSEYLGGSDGKRVGYKVGFTGKAGQEKFGIPHPAYGILLNSMFIENKGEIEANFGFRPMIEPDLMVVVKNDAIMQATTKLEVAQHLESIHAFIEMPTIQFPLGKPFTSNQLIALNVAATKMVMGEGVKIEASQEFLNKLANAQTTFTDDTGKLIQAAPLKNLMEHPFNAVLWLIKEFKKHGKSLNKGDRISLGAVGNLFPLADSNRTYTYSISGLGEIPIVSEVSVKAVK